MTDRHPRPHDDDPRDPEYAGHGEDRDELPAVDSTTAPTTDDPVTADPLGQDASDPDRLAQRTGLDGTLDGVHPDLAEHPHDSVAEERPPAED